MSHVVRDVFGVKVSGIEVDPQTRCRHYHSAVDIIAIKFPCCRTYFPCYECHEALAHHAAARWRKDQRLERAVLCGSCGHQLTIQEYLNSGYACTACQAPFNPGCRLHVHLYFDS